MSVFDSIISATANVSLSNIGTSSTISSIIGTIIPFLGKIPIPNELSTYATYDYILGIGVLSIEQYNNPDKTYIAGQRIPLICKSANVDPSNRVQTIYGKFDFFVDNLVLENIIGFEDHNSCVTTMTFDIYEPYAMGMFVLAVQTAANQAGWLNWREAPLILTIEFRGNQQNGLPLNMPNTYRYIPFNLTNMKIHTTEKGTTYNCEAYASNAKALTSEFAKSKSDVSITGKTVQQMLQTGEKSLQAVLNARAKQLVEDGAEHTPTQYVIMFPIDAQSSAQGSGLSDLLSTLKSIISFFVPGTTLNSNTSLGSWDTNDITNIQCNDIGQAKMTAADRRADPPTNKEDAVWDDQQKIWMQGNNTYNLSESSHTYSSTQNIEEIINNVILQSEYPKTALGLNAIDDKGMRQWWMIDTQMYFIKDDENLKKTGITPRVIVYRILPYKSHAGKISAPNVQPPGYDQIKAEIVKQYDYIYTGKNTEIIDFKIDFSNSFANIVSTDVFARAEDVQTAADDGFGEEFGFLGGIIGGIIGFAKSLFQGFLPSIMPGVIPSQIRYTKTTTTTDRQGGGGQETESNRMGRDFHDATSNPNDMIELNMKIQGDPFWIAHSGNGNYTATPTQYKDLNADGSVSYQTSEVDILINFRCPLDINQLTGLYDFGIFSQIAPVISFSGIYHVTRVTSSFKEGKFTQDLKGFRRSQQENPNKGGPDVLLSIKNLIS